jgi:hypothetical protein
MQNAKITGDFFCHKDILGFEEKLNGVKYTKLNLLLAFNDLSEYIVGGDGNAVVEEMFKA